MVMHTDLLSLALDLKRIAVVVIQTFPQYFVAPLVHLLWTSNVLHYQLPQVIENINISLLFVILLKMTPMNIIVIFVKKNESESIGSTIVQIVVILLIPNVFLENPQMSTQIVTTSSRLQGECSLFDYHPHTLTFIEETKYHPQSHSCNDPCKEINYQYAQCNFNMHNIVYRNDK